MDIYYKPIDSIEVADINKLIDEKIPESLIIDYKLKLPGNSDAEKKEFLADVTSFANASGGILLYGVQEEKNSEGQNTECPEKIVPINLLNPNLELDRLLKIIQDSVEPKLFGILYKVFEINKNNFVVLIKVPNSISSPHIVWYKNSGKFFKRVHSKKIQLDVHEIKNAFFESDDNLMRIKEFLTNRITEVRTQNFIPNLDIDGSTFIHILPINKTQIDLKTIKEKLCPAFFSMGLSGCRTYFNFEGILNADFSENQIQSYIQFMRDGGIEIYNSVFHYKRDSFSSFQAIQFEQYFFNYIESYFEACKKIDLMPPFIIYLSVFDIDKYSIITSSEKKPIYRKQVFLPSIVIYDFNENIRKIFHSIFNILWQSFGYSECEGYEERNKNYFQ